MSCYCLCVICVHDCGHACSTRVGGQRTTSGSQSSPSDASLGDQTRVIRFLRQTLLPERAIWPRSVSFQFFSPHHRMYSVALVVGGSLPRCFPKVSIFLLASMWHFNTSLCPMLPVDWYLVLEMHSD